MPEVNYFKPAGVPMVNLKESVLTVSEYEAIRLIDSNSVSQKKAGKKMKISQPTLSRLLKSARKKLSDAIVNGKAIKIKGGSYRMAQPKGKGLGPGKGAGKGLRRRAPSTGGRGRQGGIAAGPGGKCKCPKCGYKKPQVRGQPCIKQKCPECGTQLVRAQ